MTIPVKLQLGDWLFEQSEDGKRLCVARLGKPGILDVEVDDEGFVVEMSDADGKCIDSARAKYVDFYGGQAQTTENPPCRLARCLKPDNCNAAGMCLSTADREFEYRDFLQRDAIPALGHIMKMLDTGAPTTSVRTEVQALLMRAARTV